MRGHPASDARCLERLLEFQLELDVRHDLDALDLSRPLYLQGSHECRIQQHDRTVASSTHPGSAEVSLKELSMLNKSEQIRLNRSK